MTDDEKLAERIARAQHGKNHWREATDWQRRRVIENWLDRIEVIRHAGLEIVEREDGR